MKYTRTDAALFLDRFLCGALVICVRLIKPWITRFKPFDQKGVKEIVVSKYVGLGSILLTRPLIVHLKSSFPKAKITFLTFGVNRELFNLMVPSVDHVLEIQADSIKTILTSSVRAVRILKKRKIDLFLDLEFFSRFSALICFFSQPRSSVGYESTFLSSRTSLYSHPAKFVSRIPIAENFVNHLRTLKLNINGHLPEIQVSLSTETNENMRKKIESLGPGHFLIFNPSASDALGGYRRWAQDKWIELVRLTCRLYSFPIIFTGLQEDKPQVDHIISELIKVGLDAGRVQNFSGKTTLYEYFALIEMSRLVVTVDSGTAHFAISLKKPTVILFGPETPQLYGYEQPFCRNVYKNLFCSPCYNIYQGKKVVCRNENRCMTAITPEEVFAAVKDLMPHG